MLEFESREKPQSIVSVSEVRSSENKILMFLKLDAGTIIYFGQRKRRLAQEQNRYFVLSSLYHCIMGWFRIDKISNILQTFQIKLKGKKLPAWSVFWITARKSWKTGADFLEFDKNWRRRQSWTQLNNMNLIQIFAVCREDCLLLDNKIVWLCCWCLLANSQST